LLAASRAVAISTRISPAAIVADEKFRLTAATTADCTVTDAKPVFPPAVAVMVTAPELTPVTTPDALTVATAGLVVPHDTD
jgi:hypothetical protein